MWNGEERAGVSERDSILARPVVVRSKLGLLIVVGGMRGAVNGGAMAGCAYIRYSTCINEISSQKICLSQFS